MLRCSVAMCSLCCPSFNKHQHAHLTAVPCILLEISMPYITQTFNTAFLKKENTAAPDSSPLEAEELGQSMLTWHCSVHLLRVIVHRLVS